MSFNFILVRNSDRLLLMKDKQIEALIKAERARQKRVINLIPSENYVSKDVLTALGSEFNNKYAEGYPHARYYGGNENVDKVEELCQTRALKLFKLKPNEWSVNVQPLSGSPANLAVYHALVPPHGKIMGMALDHGGHLTHGHKVSATGKFWTPVYYGVGKAPPPAPSPKEKGSPPPFGGGREGASEVLDYEEIKKIATREKPAIIVAGYTAYPRIVDWKKFREICNECGALLMVDMSHIAGLVAGGVYPSPFPYAHIVTTTTHKTLRGPRAALIFSRRVTAGNLPSGLTGKEGNSSIRQVSSLKQIPTLDKLVDRAVFPGLQGGPHVNQIAGVAGALAEASKPEFKTYAKQVVKNAKALAGELKKLGWRLVSDGTDSHLILMDVWMGGKGIGGKEASDKLEKAGIIVNKNTIPFDTRSPMDPSGIRLGTPAETTRGKKEKDMIVIARQINKTLRGS